MFSKNKSEQCTANTKNGVEQLLPFDSDFRRLYDKVPSSARWGSASFVITQYHVSVTLAPNVVGTANATAAGGDFITLRAADEAVESGKQGGWARHYRVWMLAMRSCRSSIARRSAALADNHRSRMIGLHVARGELRGVAGIAVILRKLLQFVLGVFCSKI
ncbi:hypothetical protein [Paraburkholderia flagellata]|uniref:hypothetical protein n=1 Tax=Paraburkholderia flagellata TaxID=2883241 RepID=UPI001F1CE12D|nr:hypothetical protein [Paraburkholderia flagellata]